MLHIKGTIRYLDSNRLKIAILLFFAFCVLAISSFFFILSIGKPYLGITLSLNAQGWTIASVDPDGLVSQAGITEGDRVIEVNSRPAETLLDKYSDFGLVYSIKIDKLTVIDKNGNYDSIVLGDGSLSPEGWTRQMVWLLVSLIFWIVGLYVFLKRPNNDAAALLCLIGLLLGLMFSSNMAWTRGLSVAEGFEAFASILGPWILLHFFVILPEERIKLRRNPLIYLIYLPAVFTLIIFFLIGFPNGQPLLWFRSVRYLEVGIGFLAVTSVAFFNYFGSASVRTRQQMKIVAVSCFAALIPFSVLYLFPQAISGQSILPAEFGILFVGFIPVGMGYAVATHRLLDIDILIRRSVIYGLVTLIMAIIVSAGIFITVTWRSTLGTPREILMALALGALATGLFGPVRKAVEVTIDRFFYKDWYDYRQIIQGLTSALNSAHDLNGISRLLVGTVVRTLNLSGACQIIKAQSGFFEVSTAQGTFADSEKQKELLSLASLRNQTIEFPNSASNVSPDIAFLIPLSIGEKRIGYLCLSQKASRQNFSSNDMYLLQEIASIAAISLDGAMLAHDVSLRDTFVSVASHELRTPLQSVIGYAELLSQRDPPIDTRKKWLEKILDGSQRLNAMVDDMLNVSHIQSGKANITLTRANLNEILEETLALIKESTAIYEFGVKIEPRLPDVLVDRDKLRQVICNLLINAVKYSPKGGCITLFAKNESPGHRVIVSIKDEGIGIGPEDKDRLFTAFHRIQRIETRGIRGSGLGLYIAKQWIEAMGGEIWFESELNKGSTFYISIPIQSSNTL